MSIRKIIIGNQQVDAKEIELSQSELLFYS